MTVKINDIKLELSTRLGSPVQVIAQTGRKRQIERKGVLAEVYPALFVVNLDRDENNFERASFSYSDILTNAVEVNFLSGANKGEGLSEILVRADEQRLTGEKVTA